MESQMCLCGTAGNCISVPARESTLEGNLGMVAPVAVSEPLAEPLATGVRKLSHPARLQRNKRRREYLTGEMWSRLYAIHWKDSANFAGEDIDFLE